MKTKSQSLWDILIVKEYGLKCFITQAKFQTITSRVIDILTLSAYLLMSKMLR